MLDLGKATSLPQERPRDSPAVVHLLRAAESAPGLCAASLIAAACLRSATTSSQARTRTSSLAVRSRPAKFTGPSRRLADRAAGRCQPLAPGQAPRVKARRRAAGL